MLDRRASLTAYARGRHVHLGPATTDDWARTRALQTQKALQARLEAHRRIDQPKSAGADAANQLRGFQEAVEQLRTDLEALQRSSEIALDRRRSLAIRRSELDAARERVRLLVERRQRESELATRLKTLDETIGARAGEVESYRRLLEAAEQGLVRRRDEHDALSRKASNSDALESLLREVVSILPHDSRDCPLCGTPFESSEDLLRHIQRARERYVLTSDVLATTLASLRAQQEEVNSYQQQLRASVEALESLHTERNECAAALRRVTDGIATVPVDHQAPTESEFTIIDSELKALDETLAAIKTDSDDKTARLAVAESDVARSSARFQTIQQQLSAATLALNTSDASAEVEGDLAAADETVRSATAAARAAADADKAAEADVLARQTALHAVRRRDNDLRSQLIAARERDLAESKTLLTQVLGENHNLSAVEDAERVVQQRRSLATDRIVVLNRLWSELVIAGAEERSKAIRIQCDAIDGELQATQGDLKRLLRASSRFRSVAAELENTAESEASGALRHQRQAIQECFAAMYPHSHLNEVIVADEP